RRGDQAVDVEERHRAVRHVIGAERVVGGDRAGLGRQVALEERHLLRPRGRPACVQQQGDVFGGAVGSVPVGGELGAVPREQWLGARTRRRLDDRDRGGGGPRNRGGARADDEQLRRQVVEVEAV